MDFFTVELLPLDYICSTTYSFKYDKVVQKKDKETFDHMVTIICDEKPVQKTSQGFYRNINIQMFFI